jgi:hypothetical protein
MAGAAFGGLIGGGLALGAASLGARMGPIGERAALEKGELQAALLGGGAPQPGHYGINADVWGATPQESLQMMNQGAGAVGMRSLTSRQKTSLTQGMFAADRSGMSTSSMTGLASTYGAGGGATQGLTSMGGIEGKVMGLMKSMGVTGSRADEVMSTLVGAVSSRASGGRMTDTDAMLAFTNGLNKTGYSEVSGTGAARASARMVGYGTNAAQSFSSNFAGMGQAAMLAQAFQGGGSLMDIQGRLDKMGQDPVAVRAAQTAIWGKNADLALVGMGESARSSRGILAARPGMADPFTDNQPKSTDMVLTRAQAKRANRRQDNVDVPQAKLLIKLAEDANQFLMDLTRGSVGDAFITKLDELARRLGL